MRATRASPGWLVLPGDLPLIQPDSLCRVAAALPSHAVVLPEFQGLRGHPVGFSAACLAELEALSGDGGAAAVVRRHQARGGCCSLRLDDPGIVTDIDTLDDLARAQARWQSRSTGQ